MPDSPGVNPGITQYALKHFGPRHSVSEILCPVVVTNRQATSSLNHSVFLCEIGTCMHQSFDEDYKNVKRW